MVLSNSALGFALARSESAAGSVVNGIVHNMNNPLHALTMQTELFLKALDKDDLEAIRPNLREKCFRLQRIGEDLKSQLEALAWRDTYTSRNNQLIDPVHFGNWFLEFWRYHLFFKHNFSTTIVTDPAPPHIMAIPLAITWSLEEPLVTLLDLFQNTEPQISFKLQLTISPLTDGAAFQLYVAPESGPVQAPAQPIFNEFDVRSLTSSLGWDWKATLEGGSLSVQLIVPARPGVGENYERIG
ncbi:hypothetical protein SAMN05660653_02960 [Desulfonatronum thiosulfatophilum]|uniref:histidine kinase n=1 Tax=Desulfonatronum thiosulfatophilum TaxID=617002 RepID=A0A1G6EM58_9BACT|nr:hypothetical protein [Desulfonatronum thiosulfatophilum]SDB58392.1 hypothetical protein SAMN05660653_02960 [Desulfonatronum thiosulfatophilum]